MQVDMGRVVRMVEAPAPLDIPTQIEPAGDPSVAEPVRYVLTHDDPVVWSAIADDPVEETLTV